MPGDNFKVEVVSEGKAHFDAAVRLAWSNCPGGKATHYLTPVPAHNCDDCYGSGKRTAWVNPKETVEYPCQSCHGGKIDKAEGMVLLWNKDYIRGQDAMALPFPLTVDAAISFLWEWLQTADFGQEPDQDGSNGKGFVVKTGDFWGHVEGSHYAFIGVYPDWQMYGK